MKETGYLMLYDRFAGLLLSIPSKNACRISGSVSGFGIRPRNNQ